MKSRDQSRDIQTKPIKIYKEHERKEKLVDLKSILFTKLQE